MTKADELYYNKIDLSLAGEEYEKELRLLSQTEITEEVSIRMLQDCINLNLICKKRKRKQVFSISQLLPMVENEIKRFNSVELKMLKDEEEKRRIDSGSCGYDSCKEMAVAIYNVVNRKENCIHIEDKLAQEQEEKKEHEKRLDGVIDEIEELDKATELAQGIDKVKEEYKSNAGFYVCIK